MGVKTLDRYLYDIQGIPAEHRTYFEKANRVMRQAWSRPQRLFRVDAGYYYVCVVNEQDGKEIVEIEYVSKARDDAPYNGWLAREAHNPPSWYSDPYDNLRQLKKEMKIE